MGAFLANLESTSA